MKELSISTLNYYELKNSSKKWLFIFLSLIFSEIILLGMFYYKQRSKYKQLLSEVQTLESFVEMQQHILVTKSKLKQDYDLLINKKAYLIGNTKLPKLILKYLTKYIPADCCISFINFKNSIISIQGIAKNWISFNNFFDALSTLNKLGIIRLKNSSKEAQHINFEIEFDTTKTLAA